MKKILTVAEIICSHSLIAISILLLILQNTISYEEVSAFEATPKSNLFVVMEHNHILGYLFIAFGIILAILTAIRLHNKEEK